MNFYQIFYNIKNWVSEILQSCQFNNQVASEKMLKILFEFY